LLRPVRPVVRALVRLEVDAVVALPGALRLVPPDEALALRPGAPLGIGGGAVVEHAAVVRPGEGPAAMGARPVRAVRLAHARLVVALFGKAAAIEPAAAGGGAVGR